MKERAVLYARISLDRRDEAGIKRQLESMRHLADAKGWVVIDEIAENDVSAYDHRPGYAKLWTLVTSGAVDHVLCWQTSRLIRSRHERAELIETFGKHSVDIVAVQGPSVDLRNAYGRFAADLMTSFNSMETEVLAERVSASIQDLKRKGRHWGIAPYGWEKRDGKLVVVPNEATVVQQLVDRLLAGESQKKLTRELNEAGVKPPGNVDEWADSTIRYLVQRRCNIGMRSETIKGDWEPIIAEVKYRRVCALLKDPGRRTNKGSRPGARRHLLTNGVGICGVCGGQLRVSNQRARSEPIYTCRTNGCTGRVQHHVDHLVGRVVVARMNQPDAMEIYRPAGADYEAASARVLAIEARLDEAALSFAQNASTKRQMEVINAELMPELEQAIADRDRLVRGLDVEEYTGIGMEEWEDLGVLGQRALLEALNITVIIKRRRLKGPGFEADSIEVAWN